MITKKFIKGIFIWALNSSLLVLINHKELHVFVETGKIGLIEIFIVYLLWGFTSMVIVSALSNTKNKKADNINYLTYVFVDNSILLKTETIQKNGFQEVWRQENEETHSIQILCFNPEKQEFKAFDRFHWMDEPYYSDGKGCFAPPAGCYYKEDLWTPIELHYTVEWLQENLQ